MYRWRQPEPTKFCLWTKSKGGSYYKLSYFENFYSAMEEALERCQSKKIDQKISFGDNNTLLEVRWTGKVIGLVGYNLDSGQSFTARKLLKEYRDKQAAPLSPPQQPLKQVNHPCGG